MLNGIEGPVTGTKLLSLGVEQGGVPKLKRVVARVESWAGEQVEGEGIQRQQQSRRGGRQPLTISTEGPPTGDRQHACSRSHSHQRVHKNCSHQFPLPALVARLDEGRERNERVHTL